MYKMTEKQIYFQRIKEKLNSGQIKSTSTQTGNNDELIIHFNNNKFICVYYSQAYKEVVLSFNFGSKAFIINKEMWTTFKKYLNEIDILLKNDRM